MAESDANTLQLKESESSNNLSKSKDSSLSILTVTPIQNQNQLSKSLARGLDDDSSIKPLTSTRQYTTSCDDLVEHRKTLYTCYSSKAITMYNVSSNLKDYTGSTASMFTLNKSVRTQKISRSSSGEDKYINGISASTQNMNNSTPSPKVRSFKDKLFVFKKNRSSQQWLDDFLRKNIVDEKPVIEKPSIIDSNTNLSILFNLEEYNSNYDLVDLYNSLMKIGENFNYTLNHEPFWQTQPKVFPECDVHDIQTLSKELHIFQDDPDMTIEGIEYKTIEGKVIPNKGKFEAVLDSLIFPTSQETQFTDAFLELYRFYITPLDLLKFIISWFNVKLPKGATKDQQFFYDENKKNIQQRCLKLLNFWIRLHWHDFSSSAVMSLLNKFMNQIGDMINNTILYGEYTKLDTILRKQKLKLFTKQYTSINEFSTSPVKSKFYVPSDNKKPWVLTMTSQEFSSQLLLHERDLFKEIEPDYYLYLFEDVKLMDENYGKFTMYKPIRLFLSYMKWFYDLSQYTITVIGEQPNIKKKIFALKKFIKIAKTCLVNKNYNSAAAIYFSLKNQLFVRQHVLWGSLPNELIENIEDLDNIFSSSYNYHYEIQQLDLQPYPDDNVVPFLADHIKQLIEQTKFEDKISLECIAEDSGERKNEVKTIIPINDKNSTDNEDSSEKKINILNWLSANQIVMEVEKWRLSIKNQSMEALRKNNTENNIIGDQVTAEKTANHISNYPKWDRMKIVEQTLPYNLSLKSSSKKSCSYSKYNNIKEEASPLFYSVNELTSPSPLSAPPIQCQQRLEIQPNEAERVITPISPSSPDTPNTAI